MYICIYCNEEFKPNKKKQKYCSQKCANTHKNKSKEHIEKVKYAISGGNHYAWRGEKGSYGTKHTWIRKYYGNPLKCEWCGVVGKRNKRSWTIHWANKTGKYTRNKDDYIGLCTRCHHKLDDVGFKKGHPHYPRKKI